jgi:hypothetical protein
LPEVAAEVKAKAMPGAISVETGVEEMLQGIEQKKPVIIVPFGYLEEALGLRENFNYYIADDKNRVHAICQQLREARMKNWAAKGTIW